MDQSKIFEIGKQIGEIVGTHCNNEQIKVFEQMLEDYKLKDKIIDKMAELISKHLNDFWWYEVGADTETKEDVIQYFTDEVKEQNNGQKYKI